MLDNIENENDHFVSSSDKISEFRDIPKTRYVLPDSSLFDEENRPTSNVLQDSDIIDGKVFGNDFQKELIKGRIMFD